MYKQQLTHVGYSPTYPYVTSNNPPSNDIINTTPLQQFLYVNSNNNNNGSNPYLNPNPNSAPNFNSTLLNPGNINNNAIRYNSNYLILSISNHMSMIRDHMLKMNQHYFEMEQIIDYLKNQN
ncbi:1720_t:CDS:1 [Entrophospora sp. SA101]|nr:10501_t:CDS:1 [Entrophospora sp. SA101]CAJ0635350.1 7994_t:CDS:1 [Entrophospora sp. SA101]CAJ0746304.1 18663_t:CDS:1 [Entrophospora sp. SA101]CAJ0769412.1 1720_t:CDS:1 [Entrophospora sp. SA101]CAJ0852209.1 16309_t:CDS:1 [Entrophospora sp. SA101]